MPNIDFQPNNKMEFLNEKEAICFMLPKLISEGKKKQKKNPEKTLKVWLTPVL